MATDGLFVAAPLRIDRAIGTTASDGRVTWTFPAGAFPVAPIVNAIGIDPNTGDGQCVIVDLESRTTTTAVFRVYQNVAIVLGGNPAAPVGAGVTIAMLAVAV